MITLDTAAKSLEVVLGGAVTTQDPELAARLRRLRSHGMNRDWEQHEITAQALDSKGQPNPWYYEMQEVGLNYRVPDILCALGLSQLAKLDPTKTTLLYCDTGQETMHARLGFGVFGFKSLYSMRDGLPIGRAHV
mgnify:CR=1 FL=1